MKAVMRKMGEVALSLLLIGLICIPVPAMSALAEEADGETLDQSAQAQSQADESDDNAEASEANEEADADADDPTATAATDDAADPDNATASDEAAANDATPTAAAAGQDADAAATDAAEPTDPNTFKVSNAEELQAAFSTINANAADGPYTISLTDDIDLSTTVSLSSAKTVALEGNGHTITLEGSASVGVDAAKATLTLNDGLTIEASASHTGSMVTVQHGTLNMNSGAVIEGNGVDSVAQGGGVSVTNKGTFNMNGGTIQNCDAHTGAGVYVCAATFNMSGDAVIQNCNANFHGTGINGDGGGVFLNVDRRTGPTKMTMGGNAVIRNSSANSLGGGVFLETATMFTMEGNASIVGNSADAGGGVMNYGMATLTAVYNNTAKNGGDDIFNNGRMKLSPVNTDWVLSRTGTHVTGWFNDAYHTWDGTVDEDVAGHRWTPGAEYNTEYIPTDGITTEQLTLTAGAPVPVNVIWEDSDGTQLFKLANVEPQDIPDADEYVALSGNAEPMKASDTKDSYEFEGWDMSEEPNGDVIYMAEYEAIPITDHGSHSDNPEPVDEATHDNTSVAEGMPQLGDDMGWVLVFGGIAIAASAAGIVLIGRKLRA